MKQTTKQFLCVTLFLLSASSATAQLKPEAMMLPINFSGVKSTEERAILQNHVLTELSAYYDLKSEQEVESARDAAIDKLSSENCTEEACVKIMGDLLDVEHTFSFSVIAAGNYWDLSATRLDYFGTTARRNSACEQCTLPLARKILTELIVGLRPGTAVIKHGEAILTLESEPRALVFWEGIEQGSTPLELTVPTDRPAEILAVAEGYQDFSNFFELKTGEHRKVNIRLVRRRGLVEITTEPSGANIFLDSKPLTASGGQALRTPSTIRPEYGKHTLTLKLEKHQDVQTQLTINRPNLGTKKYTFQPNPGRLIVRVPAEFKNSDVYINDRKIGNMGGKIAKSFEVKSKKRHKIQAKWSNQKTEISYRTVAPEKTEKVELNLNKIIPVDPSEMTDMVNDGVAWVTVYSPTPYTVIYVDGKYNNATGKYASRKISIPAKMLVSISLRKDGINSNLKYLLLEKGEHQVIRFKQFVGNKKNISTSSNSYTRNKNDESSTPNSGILFSVLTVALINDPLLKALGLISALTTYDISKYNKNTTLNRLKFIRNSYVFLQEDVSRGQGEHLSALRVLMGCSADSHNDFSKTLRNNREDIFRKDLTLENEENTLNILQKLKGMIQSTPVLLRRCGEFS